MTDVTDVWVYLSTTPLLHLTLTLAAFSLGSAIYEKAGRNPVLNPVLIAVALLVGLLTFTGTSYERYFEGAQFVHFLLGPATVCLALPLYRQFDKVRHSALALSAAILSGSLTASATAVGFAWLAGGDMQTLLSLASKSVTAPVAMGISEQLGGIPALTAAMVIVTGIIGATLGPLVLTLIGVKDWAARGVAMGTGSHGIGTARALQVNELAGAFSGLAMGLNALATAILLPVIFALIW